MGALVFFYTEKNQDWTYFQALYFSYTTLLTIGYGDFIPMSNSGKPFFVFWSLLAVPTLTILISNMGDTVVKGVKDLTIWIGEVTVLPGEKGSALDSLKYGFYKATLGKVEAGEKVTDEESADRTVKSFREMHPGLVKLIKPPKEENNTHGKPQGTNGGEEGRDHFVEGEKKGEEQAKAKGDITAENDHHYRHVLVTQIRKVYKDSTAPNPKKYSYEEWAYFLKLLGEDENDSTYHRRAPTKTEDPRGAGDKNSAAREKRDFEQGGQKDAHAPGQARDDDKEGGITTWSWLGDRSPLMGDKDEAAWILERLFDRLGESMQDQMKEKEESVKKEDTNNPQGVKEGDQRDAESESTIRAEEEDGSKDHIQRKAEMKESM